MLRRFTQEDMRSYRRLMAICYTYAYEDKDEEPVSEKQLSECYGVFGEDGTLKSAMSQLDMTCWFEGHKCKMLGIGGVVTDPVARKEGGIRQLFEEGLPRLYQEGYVFSALYPFSHVFYRKFGYEYAVEQHIARFEPHSLRKDLKAAAYARRLLPENDGAVIEQLYEGWASRYNLAFDLTGCWKQYRSGQPWQLKHTYVFYNEENEPISFWIGSVNKSSGSAVLDLSHLAWKNRQGMEAIFSMLRGMNEIQAVKLKVPPGLSIRHLLEDPYDIAEEKLDCGGMARVMNVEKALALLPAPAASGEMVIEVQDAQIAENCGCFLVHGNGKALSVQKVSDASPDLRCSIGGLTVLLLGALGLEDAALAGFADISEKADKKWIGQVFTSRDRYMNRYF